MDIIWFSIVFTSFFYTNKPISEVSIILILPLEGLIESGGLLEDLHYPPSRLYA